MSIEWALVFFTVFVGLGCGIFVSSVAITEWGGMAKQVRMKSSIAALAALVVGGISSVLHLGHPERIFGALAHPTSGIFLEALMIGLIGLDIIIYLVAMRRNVSDLTLKVISTIGAVLAVILAFAVGRTYMLPSRPAWDTLLLPLIYLVTAGVMGCFSISVLVLFTRNANTTLSKTATETAATTETATNTETQCEMATLKRVALVSLAIEAVLFIAYLIHLAIAPYPDVTRSAARVLSGDLAPLFWGGLIVLGLLVPAALLAKINAKKTTRSSSSPLRLFTFGLICVIISSVAFRCLMFLLGSSIKHF